MNEVNEKSESTSAVKELADAVSIQVRVANRVWYISMAVALIVLFPPIGAGKPISHVELPFKIGSVDGYNFYPIIFVLFSVLIVAFASAHAQAVRANTLAHQTLKKIKSVVLLDIHAIDLFDMFRQASVNRVAPLAQLMRGKYQFYNSENCPTWLRVVTTFYYLILKLIAAGVYWFLPAFAFWLAFTKAQDAGMSSWYLIPIFTIGASSMFVVALSDLKYVFDTAKILFRPQSKNAASYCER